MGDGHHDDWFKHTPEEGVAQHAHGEINAPFIIAFLAVVIVITFALLFILLGYFGREVASEQGIKSEGRTEILARQHIESSNRWRAELEGDPRWIDMQTRTVRLPLEYAAREVVQMYGSDSGSRN